MIVRHPEGYINDHMALTIPSTYPFCGYQEPAFVAKNIREALERGVDRLMHWLEQIPQYEDWVEFGWVDYGLGSYVASDQLVGRLRLTGTNRVSYARPEPAAEDGWQTMFFVGGFKSVDALKSLIVKTMVSDCRLTRDLW